MRDLFRRNPKQPDVADNKTDSETTKDNAPMFSWNRQQPSNKAVPEQHNIPDDLWIKCTKCHELIYTKEFEINKKVCTKCNYHTRLSARERVTLLADDNSFEEMDAGLISADPLGFVSIAEPPYLQKMAQTRKKTGENEALVTGLCTINGKPIALAICNFAFQGGSMGSVFGEKMARVVEKAIEKRIPMVTISASGGARMHEGLFSLMQLGKISVAFARLGQLRLPHFSVFTDPTLGGVTASYASVADVMIAEPGALIGFAGPRVIEQTTKQKLPPGFQTAEFMLEHGMVDLIVPRRELKDSIANLVNLYMLAHNRSYSHEVAYAG
ncbi:acetyl-CoA carboxylase, carboxyltransferase subunit beta [Candidatus Chlorohelix sp.]|uniref:acetyl-CoA carboxylase, carboxyltransferase subunit beta n=1 Tax=Candidatus Chlorohelix sp. TaxID=3139201 RepID=UPI00305CAE3F